MNGLGLAMIGVAARSAMVGLAAIALVALLSRRRGPASAAMAAMAGLVGLVLTSALSIAPWPGGWTLGFRAVSGPAVRPEGRRTILPDASRSVAVRDVVRAGDRARGRSTGVPVPSPDPDPPLQGGRVPDRGRRGSGLLDRLSEHRGLSRGIEPEPGPSNVEPPGAFTRIPSWPTWVAGLMVAGWSLGAIRLAAGLLVLRRHLAASEPVDDPELLGLAETLRAALGSRRPVAIRQSPTRGLPATAGWLRPCILLPGDWRDWTGDERRVVLAHELAHVRRGDFPGRLVARLCLIVHFYHPVAHWLAARLRLHQELAADAWGIRLSGGRATYLSTLARMALRHDSGRPEWAARPILPFGGQFLRRMDMLCNEKTLGESPTSSPWRTRAITFGLLAAVALLATAVRPPLAPAGDIEVVAAPTAQGQDTRKAEVPFDLSRVPADAVGVVAIRPSSLLAEDDLHALMNLAKLDDNLGMELAHFAKMGLAPESIEQVIYVQLRADLETILKDELSIFKRGFVIVKTSTPIDSKAATVELEKFSGKLKLSLFIPDNRTAIVGEEATIKQISNGPPRGDFKFAWSEAWKAIERSQIAIAFDAAYVRGMTDPLITEGLIEVAMFASPLAPIWEGAKAISLGMSIDGDQIEILSLNTAGSAEGAETTYQTVQAVMILGKNAAGSIKRQFRKAMFATKGGFEGFVIVKMVDLVAGRVFQQMRVERTGNSVRFTARLDLDTLFIVARGF